jgi:uncharacterized protein
LLARSPTFFSDSFVYWLMRDEVRERARPYFDGASPCHDWQHVRRVAQMAETLAEEYDVDEEVLFAAVWLHDVGRAKEDRGEIEDHAEWGATEADQILTDLGASDETISAVQNCIRAHRYSNDVEPETREAEILCDADNLDAIGAVGIARCFSFGGEHGFTIHDPDLPVEADDSDAGETQLNHVQKKLLSLRDRIYTELGRKIAEDRHEYVAEFAERFADEAGGEL